MPSRHTRRQFLNWVGLGALGALTAAWYERWGIQNAAAQSLISAGLLTGITSEMGSGKPLAGVLLSAGDKSTASDSAGRYSLELLPGAYELRAEAPGYIGMTAAGLVVNAGTVLTCNLELVPSQPSAALAELISERISATAGSGSPAATQSANTTSSNTLSNTIRVVTNYVNPPPEGWVPNVVTMELEEYLRGVVPYEMSPGSPKEALKAQAVAARSYAAAGSNHYPYADVCTTTHCQYRGSTYYYTTDQAINATRGIVVTYGGYIAQTFYFGHCIGQTIDATYNRWYAPWCQSVPCEPCASHHYTEYWGHGVGMCQEGAEGYASAPYNWNYAQILHHYYTGISLTAPTPIRITAPADNTAVRGVLLVTLGYDIEPTYVDFYLDTSPNPTHLTQVTAAPWQMRLNTTTLSDGAYTLRAVAVIAGYTSEATVHITVDNTKPVGAASAPTGWLRSTHVPIALTWNEDAKTVQFSNAWRWEGEGSASGETILHSTGSKITDGSALNGYTWCGQQSTDAADTWYGPYTCALPLAPEYQAYFRIKTGAIYPTVALARLDVADSYGQRLLCQRDISSEDLPFSMTYEEFMLRFAYADQAGTCAAPGMHGGLEFRTYYLANRDLYLDCVTVYSAPQALAPTITWDAHAVNGEQTIWVRLLDAAGNACDCQVTVQIDLTYPALTQQGANAALAQDTVSGLDPASARWSDSTDGGATWSDWQPFGSPPCTAGTLEPVLLSAPAGAADDVRYLIRDMAGNFAFTRGIPQELPLVFNQK
ncbi:MAG: SpoIID/LytB domain-containing protein [Chloroflexi bacterium]|nr:SpoIID/LytB domain-containing protein [Chloroflexota bacterium]